MADYWRRSVRLLAAIAFPSLLGLLIVRSGLRRASRWATSGSGLCPSSNCSQSSASSRRCSSSIQSSFRRSTKPRRSFAGRSVSFVAALCRIRHRTQLGHHRRRGGVRGLRDAHRTRVRLVDFTGPRFSLPAVPPAPAGRRRPGSGRHGDRSADHPPAPARDGRLELATRLGACIAVGAVVYPALCSPSRTRCSRSSVPRSGSDRHRSVPGTRRRLETLRLGARRGRRHPPSSSASDA